MRLLSLLLLLPSCVATHVKTQTWEVSRVSVLSGHEVPGLSITRDGTATLTGYTGRPDAESVKAITEGVTRALIKP